MDVADHICAAYRQDDVLLENRGIKIVVNTEHLPLLEGTEIDFVRQGLSNSFRFRNPNVSGDGVVAVRVSVSTLTGRGSGIAWQLDEITRKSIDALLNAHSILLFIEGNAGSAPMRVLRGDCQYSRYACVANTRPLMVLENAPLREGIKTYGQWPTIPQLYVNGELIGGL